MSGKLQTPDWSRLDKIVKIIDWNEHDVTFSPEERNNRLSIAIVGHSYISHMVRDMTANYQRTGQTPQDQLLLRGTQIYPSLFGMSGGKVADLPLLAHVAQSVNPHVLIIEMAQNDLCKVNSDAETVADNLIAQTEALLKVLPRVEVIAYCQVIVKTEIRYGKPLDMLNEDSEKFNIHMLKKTRGDLKNMRWRHMGMFDPEEPITWDGTHPNSEKGKIKYWTSISDLCKATKQRVSMLRIETKSAIKRKMKREKRERREEYWRKKEEKATTQSKGRARRFPNLVGKI
jgi:hypothetical protein